MVRILVKKFDKNIKLPTYKTAGSSGMDLVAYIKNKITINPGKTAIIPTGIAVAVPKNYEIQIRPRSGLAAKKSISVLNTPGTVDSDFRGEIKIILINLKNNQVLNMEKSIQVFFLMLFALPHLHPYIILAL